ncbi:MAG: hypothetical protein ACLQJR_22170 [Stellaceae bacterium]
MTELWPWLTLAGLGAFHGVNPAMGWLFAVALALHRRSRATLLWALPPLALGHALSIGLVAAAVMTAGVLIDRRSIQLGAGLFLMGWAGYHYAYGHRHRVRVGMTTGLAGLVLWSFLMATAHGAGLMILPALMPLCLGAQSGARTAAAAGMAVGLHTVAMLAVTGLLAAVIYEWVGLAILRRAWLNVDLLWTSALALTGLLLLIYR